MDYKYILFTLITPQAAQISEENLNEVFKHKLHAVNLIYPTHDGRAYAVFKKGKPLDDLDANLAACDQSSSKMGFKLKKHQEKDNSFIECRYLKVKSDFFPKLNSFASRREFVNKCYALDLSVLIDSSTKEELELLSEVDSYQYNLLIYIHSLQDLNLPSLSKRSSDAKKEANSFEILKDLRNFLEFKHNDTNVTFVIKYDDMLDEQVDVIVNAANERLLLGGGIAGAIDSRCGPKVQQECDDFLEKIGFESIAVSQVMHTRAYNIHARYVIHAVGPRWYDYKSNEKKACYEDLKNTFFNCLMYAETKLKNVESIGIPLISSGIFGVPKEVCCEALYEAICEYLNESNNAGQTLKLVTLINKDHKTTKELCEYFASRLKSNLDFNANQKQEKIN